MKTGRNYKMKTVSFKINDETFEKIKNKALKYNLSVSAWIRIFLLKALNEELEVVDELSKSNSSGAWAGSSGK